MALLSLPVDWLSKVGIPGNFPPFRLSKQHGSACFKTPIFFRPFCALGRINATKHSRFFFLGYFQYFWGVFSPKDFFCVVGPTCVCVFLGSIFFASECVCVCLIYQETLGHHVFSVMPPIPVRKETSRQRKYLFRQKTCTSTKNGSIRQRIAASGGK